MSSNTISILITGSNQGLGYEAALQLSKHAHVHLIISGRNASRVEEALVKIKKDAGCQAKVQSVVIDVSDDGSIQAAVAEVEKLLDGKPLDVLVNNSGIYVGLNVGFDDLRQSFLETFAVNVFGAACMAAALLPSLKRSNQAGGGRILNVSSGLASITLMSDPNGPYAEMHSLVYGSSKSALNALTCTLAMTNKDLHVVALDPGYNATNMNQYSGHMDPKDGAKILVDYSLERRGKSPGYYSKDGELPW